MGCTSSDTSEFGRRRNEIEEDIDHLKNLFSWSKDATNFKNPTKMQTGILAIQEAPKKAASINEKIAGLKEHLGTLKEDPNYATKEKQLNQTVKKFEKVGLDAAKDALKSYSDVLGNL